MKARRQQQQQQSNSFISREMSLRSFLTHLFLFRGPWSLWMTMQLVLRHGDVTGAETIVLFQTVGQCPGQVLSSGLRYDSFAVRSKVQCAALCLPDFSCRSFLFNRDEGLCYLGSQAAFANCSNMDPAPPGLQHFDMMTSCRNGGSLQMNRSCACPQGFSGDDCTTVVKDCNDAYYKGSYRENGVYWIHPTRSPRPFLVYCRMIGRPRTYVMNRIYNDVSFMRGWLDYKGGFGSLDSDFWLGLEKLHMLTSSEDYEFRFRVRLRGDTNLFQFYKYAKVDDEKHHYRLTFDPDVTEGSLGDCLSYVNGANFSTPDRDYDDNDNVHCARRHGSGFWFRGASCTLCNPTGRLLQPPDQKRLGVPEEVFWTRSMGNIAPFKIGAYLVNVIKPTRKAKPKPKPSP